jgi:energy-coupling factor transporter ATP-binding protein EcfA2
MISELRIERFGRFAGQSFDFAATTVFVGPNESGKSTLFDALLAAVCRPPNNKSAGRALRQRYGDYVVPEIAGDPPVLDVDEFINLFAIRSGVYDLDLAGKSEWLQRVKSALFTGGVDPNRIIADLEAEADERRSRRHIKVYNEALADHDRLDRERADLVARREAVLSRQRQVEEESARIRRLEQQATEAAARAAEVDEHLAQQQRLRERERHRRVLGELQRAADAAAEADAAGAASPEDALDVLHATVEAARAALAAAATAERQARDERERAAATRAAAERDVRAAEAAAALAAELRRSHGGGGPPAGPGAAVVATAVAAAAALGAGLLAPLPPWGRAAAFAAAALAALAALAAGLLQHRRATVAGGATAADRLREEWKRRGGPGELRAARREDLLAELLVLEGGAAHASERVAATGHELAGRESAAASARDQAARAREELAAAEQAEGRWLREHGAASADDYRRRRARRLAAERLLAEARRMVAQAAGEYECVDDASLRAELDRRIRDLDAAIVETPLPEPGVRRLEAERGRLRDSLARLAREREAVKEGMDLERGGIRTSLGEIPQRLLAVERALAVRKAELGRLERTRKAAALARDLFAELARDSDATMEQLAAEIAAVYGELAGATRGVSLGAFDLASARAVDAGGESREVDALSSGTRDLFVLAARLALAARSRPGPALLVLDEALQAIDDGRADRVIGMLRRYQQERGWQIVLFTRDPQLPVRLQAVFPAMVTHHLARASAAVAPA